MADKKESGTVETTVSEPKFPKEKLLKAKKFAGKVDILQAFLVDSETYTIAEVDKVIEKFMKGKVV